MENIASFLDFWCRSRWIQSMRTQCLLHSTSVAKGSKVLSSESIDYKNFDQSQFGLDIFSRFVAGYKFSRALSRVTSFPAFCCRLQVFPRFVTGYKFSRVLSRVTSIRALSTGDTPMLCVVVGLCGSQTLFPRLSRVTKFPALSTAAARLCFAMWLVYSTFSHSERLKYRFDLNRIPAVCWLMRD